MKNRLGDILLFLIAIGLLSALILHSNPAVIAKTLSGANLNLVVGAISITLAIIGVKIIRWNILLRSIGIKLTLKQVMQPYMASLFVSNITPGRVGEPIRSYYLKKSTGHHISKTLPTIVVERIMDLSAVLLFSIFGLFYLSSVSNPVLIIGIGMMILGLAAVIGVSMNRKIFHKVLEGFYIIFRFVPKIRKLTPKFEKIADNFHSSFKLVAKSNEMPALFMITLICWFMEFSIIKLSFFSIGFNVGFLTIFSVASLATIISLLTFLPGNIGSFEAASAILMTQSGGMYLATATSGILIYRFSSLIFALIVTSGSFLRYQRS